MDDNRSFWKNFIRIMIPVFAAGVCVSEAFYILLESPLNPWSERLAGIDSSIFIYMGEGLNRGLVPYRDMFDHKGPLLWSIEQLGLILGGGSVTGIWLLELLALSFDIGMAYLCAKTVTGHRGESMMAACLSFVPLITLLYEGNLSEEWSLPFIYAGLYIYLQYFIPGKPGPAGEGAENPASGSPVKNQKSPDLTPALHDTPPISARRDGIRMAEVLLEGILCGAVLMIRVNGAALWAVFSVALLLVLIARDRTRDALICIPAFFGGVLLSFVPYLIWYGAKGSLKEMWDAYIGFNIYYSGLHGGFSLGNALMLSKYFVSMDLLLWLPVLLGVLVVFLEGKGCYRLLFPVFYAVSCLCAALGGEKHIHYAMYLVPCILMPLAFCFGYLRDLFEKPGGRIGVAAVRCVIIISCMFYIRSAAPVGEQRDRFRALSGMATEDRMMLDFISENAEEGDDILVTGLNARLYYASGHLCGSRRFIQHFMYDYDRSLMKEMLDYVDNDPPKLIISPRRNVDGDPWGEWMTEFNSELEKREREGLFTGYENEVFAAYKRTGKG